jgi:hypothetical protein
VYKSILTAVAFIAAFGGSSSVAATIDFTDRSVWSSANSTDRVAGANVSLSSTGGMISFQQNFDRSRTPACAGFGGELACDSDGLGVSGDEISTSDRRIQTVTVAFSSAVKVTGFSFLDLYIASDGADTEQADVFLDGHVSTNLMFEAIERFDGDAAGFAHYSIHPVVVTALTFRALRTNDNLGVADFALAAVEVAPVPLPAAGWMLVAALAGLAGLRRAGVRAV